MSNNYDRAADELYAPAWISRDQEPDELFSEIVPGLFQGGTSDEEWDHDGSGGALNVLEPNSNLGDQFDAVVTLFAWSKPCDWGVEELRYGFYDSHPRYADMSRVVRAARWAHERWAEGDRVLIRCQAGLNRSGLVTALVLMLAGWSPADAIKRIRERRAEVALVNGDFVDWLVADAGEALGLDRGSAEGESLTPSVA